MELETLNVFCPVFLQVKAEDQDAAEEEQEEEEEEEESWEKALSVERFRDIIGDSASCGAERMGRLYTEKDFECKPGGTAQTITFSLMLILFCAAFWLNGN